MIRALALSVFIAGCSPSTIRVAADVIDGLCMIAHGVAGTALRAQSAYDVHRDGTVTPVYGGETTAR